MKGIEIFCASQASTAICLNTNHASSSSSNTINHFGGRAIDRHNPIITDPKRTPARDLTVTAPSSPSPSSINLKHVHEKTKKNTTSKFSDKKKKNATKSTHDDQKKKSTTTTEKVTENIANNYSSKPVDSILRRSRVKPPSDLITPPTSSRYLLGDTVSLDGVLDYDPVLVLTKVDDNKKNAQVLREDEDKHSSKQYSSSSVPKSDSTNQVSISLSFCELMNYVHMCVSNLTVVCFMFGVIFVAGCGVEGFSAL